MAVPLPTLDALCIPTPCTIPWSGMRGGDRSRFCGACERPVYDLTAMTAAEAAARLGDPAGAPCVRFYRRPDGRVLTADCSVGLRIRAWRRLRRRAAWAASLFATLLLPACRTPLQGAPGDISAYPNARLPDDLPPAKTEGEAPQSKTNSRVSGSG